MSHSLRSVKLVLRSFDLPAAGTTTFAGYTTNNKTICTWTNINLVDMMGDMYDDYNQFNVVLTTISSSTSDLMGATANDRTNLVYMSGLNWANQGYNSATKQTTQNTCVGSFKFVPDTGLVFSCCNIIENTSTFNKGNNTSHLTISLARGADGNVPAANGTTPIDWNISYVFSIFGVEDSKVPKRLKY